MSTQFL